MKLLLPLRAVWGTCVYLLKSYARLLLFASPFIFLLIIVIFLGDYLGATFEMKSDETDAMILIMAFVLLIGSMIFFFKTKNTSSERILKWRKWYQRPEAPKAIKELIEKQKKK